MNVRLGPVLREQEPVLQNLMQLYNHDFSEFWAGTPKGDLQADGRFEPYPLTSYWTDPSRSAWFIWRDDVLAGFALVNDHAHSGQAIDQSVAEFFVLRKHRGSGVAVQAAHLVFATRPGLWEVAVARKNAAALRFWRKAVAATPGAADIREIDLRTPEWDGPIILFRLGA
ncbi:MAG: GNAT family N-acetyltransferase [Phenylobacterium sp.]|uniref:GNAT family N-acetyltransferase n=1 Tax=Phenylobacterium sp. TaxID=1871053 RepID=UPI002732C661|nr:GNAT family N-acetyltransferase [Phenylobacterium sp.]MDP3747603.1 GNAT family N-acetyltransferase [Phenylobacterium sp.]